MLADVVEARPLGSYRVFVRFEDGIEGEIEIAEEIRFEGVFAFLRDPKAFSLLRVDAELGTIAWENGADIAPERLYDLVAARLVTRNP